VTCDDGNACTTDSCDPAEGCTTEPVTCDDGNACTTDSCDPATGCTTEPVTCDDGDACTTDSCDPATGCTTEPVTCDDNDACTTDSCVDGECEFTALDCDDNDPCTIDSCEAGQCVNTPKTCDDGLYCNGVETCDAETGACVAGEPIVCEAPSDPTPVPDPDFFELDCPQTGSDTEIEVAFFCEGVSVRSCKDLSNIVFRLESGLVFRFEDLVGETGVFHLPAAYEGDHIQTVWVKSGPNFSGEGPGYGERFDRPDGLDCDDPEPQHDECVDYVCDDSVDACVEQYNDDPCDDGNACTTSDTCVEGQCTGSYTVTCDDGNPCTFDQCDPALGCTSQPDDYATCDDGDLCTTDACVGGTCEGTPVTCDDGAVCNGAETCDPATGECVDGQDVTCEDDGNVCTDEVCSEDAGGCVHVNNNRACDDGNVCTAYDHCVDGECRSAEELMCDDGNPCTDDSCDPEYGCTFVADDDNECSDDDLCTTDSCVDGQCQSVEIVCDDDNVCTDDYCDPATGQCATANNTASCDDGNKCNDCTEFGAPIKAAWYATNYGGGTAPHGFWLPGLYDGNTSHQVRMTLEEDAVLVWFADDTARLTGHTVVTDLGGGSGDLGQRYWIDMKWSWRGTGDAGVGSGGPKGSSDPTLTDTWEYFDLTEGGLGSVDSDEYIAFTQFPADSAHPFQVGQGANDKTGAFGGATWMSFKRFVNGQELCDIAHGDLNVDLTPYDCDGADQCVDGQCVGGSDNCDDGDDCTIDSCDPEVGCSHEPDPVCDGCWIEQCEGVSAVTLKVTAASSNRDYDEIVRVRSNSSSGTLLWAGEAPTYSSFDVVIPEGTTKIFITVQGDNHPSEYVKATFDLNCDTSAGASNGNSYITFKLTDVSYRTENVDMGSCDDGDACTIDSCDPVAGCVHEADPSCGPTCPYTLDFDTDASGAAIPAGADVSEVYAGLGVHISVKKGTSGDYYGRPISFNSDDPTGNDPDLGTPNRDFGGPGIGSGGSQGSAGENDVTLHNLMILAENTVDNNGDGLVDDPDDAVQGARFYIRFDTPSCVYSMDFVDLESPATIRLYDANYDFMGEAPVPGNGNNSFFRAEGQVCGVSKIKVIIPESGAIDNIVFCPGDGPDCPEGASCDDGDACTVGDFCTGGACTAGPGELSCDDGDPCTTDSCDAASGCVSEPIEGCGMCDTCTGVSHLKLKISAATHYRDENETIRVRANHSGGAVLWSGRVDTYGYFEFDVPSWVDKIYITVQGNYHPDEYVKGTFNMTCDLVPYATSGNSYITFKVKEVTQRTESLPCSP